MSDRPSPKPAHQPQNQEETMPHGTGLPLTIMAFMIASMVLAMVGGAADVSAKADVTVLEAVTTNTD